MSTRTKSHSHKTQFYVNRKQVEQRKKKLTKKDLHSGKDKTVSPCCFVESQVHTAMHLMQYSESVKLLRTNCDSSDQQGDRTLGVKVARGYPPIRNIQSQVVQNHTDTHVIQS